MTRKVVQSDAPDEGASITDTQVLRSHIEQTRAEMGETLEAIKEKLNPQTMINQAKETVAEVTADAAQQAQETIHTVVMDVTQQAKDTVSEVTADAAQQARETVHAVVIDVTEQAKETARGAGARRSAARSPRRRRRSAAPFTPPKTRWLTWPIPRRRPDRAW